MRQSPYSILCLAAALLTAIAVVAPSPGAAEERTRKQRRARGQLVVRPKAGASPRAIERALARSGARLQRRLRGSRAQVIRFRPRLTARVERELRRSGLFKSVERDYYAAVASDPDDTHYAAQWSLPRSGVPAAWELSTGSASVPVAVLDTGVETSHPDLAGRLLPGYDFFNDDAEPADDHGHGTRMSGVVGAAWNNGAGIAGVAPDSPIIPVKVLGPDGTGPYSAVAEGITWAADQGARVINMSLAGEAPSQAIQDAVNYAIAAGAVCVAAAGNDSSSDPVYPAATSGVVAVAAIDEHDNRAWFSNTGAWISHAAPGVGLVTTDLGGSYSSSTGTSPAAALTSGVFALLLAFEPGLTPFAAAARIEQGAFDLGSAGWDPSFGWGGVDALATLVPGEPGATPPDDTDPTVELLSPTKKSLVSGLFGVEVAANDNVGVTRVELFLDNRKHATELDPPFSFVVDAGELEPGKHKLRAYAYDAAGNREKTRNVKILTTTGVGLLVKRAKLVGDKVRITAQFTLPPGQPFDPQVDSIAVVLESAGGTVLAAAAAPSDLTVRGRGRRTSAAVDPLTPTEGRVRFKTAARGRDEEPALYKLKVKATKLDPMVSIEDVMNLAVQIGDTQLSQPLSFRPKGTQRLIYP